MLNKKLKITFVNVGYGEAVLIECPDETKPDGVFHILIDGGSADESEYADRSTGRIPIEEYLSKNGPQRLDLAICTHIHEDHISGMLRAAQLYTPEILWQTLSIDAYKEMLPLDENLAQNLSQSKFLSAYNDYIKLCTLIKNRGGILRTVYGGIQLKPCNGLEVHVLAPGKAECEKLSDDLIDLCRLSGEELLKCSDVLDAKMNNRSLILKLEFYGKRILLPGDTNYLGYDGISENELDACLFKIGHHGQKDGADKRLIEKIKPEAVVCCASSDRRYNSAYPGTMSMLKDAGAKLYFSDCPKVDGIDIPPHHALEFTIDPDGISSQYI